MMRTIGVIPARYGSTRFEGKVLADLLGKPVIQHVWERARKSQSLDELIIACDDKRIEASAKKFGAKAVFTSTEHQSGSDRIKEAVQTLEVDIVINIQGDEPLIDHSIIDDLSNALKEDTSSAMATVIKAFGDEEDIQDPNIVKVVTDIKGYALYFSRAVIPYNHQNIENKGITYYKHLGLYAYRKEFLLKFNELPTSRLEQVEKLEQLRVLEAGYKIKTVKTKINTVSIDTKEDLLRVQDILKIGRDQ